MVQRQDISGEYGFSGIAAAPVTMQRPVPEVGAPRANITVDAEHPNGTYTPPSDMTVLQQHMAFWDHDGDGTVWPTDTYKGFRDLGFDPFISFISVPIIHGTFSYWTLDSWIPHLGFPIRFKNAHRTKHGSDSETFDTEGRFVPEKFEELFSKYDEGNKGGLSLKDINKMVKGNANIMDPVGWTAGWLEWNVSYYLAAQDTPRGKLLLKDDVRSIIDGTLFHRIARDTKAGKLRRASIFKAGLSPRTASKPTAAEARPRAGEVVEKATAAAKSTMRKEE